MRLIVYALESLGGQVGVNLRGDHVRMAKQLLNTAQISACIQEVRRVTVTELMLCQFRSEVGYRQLFF